MDVLILDAHGRQWASDGCNIPEHYPALFVAADTCKRDNAHCGFSPDLEEKLGYLTEDPDHSGRELSGSWLLSNGDVTVSLLGGSLSGPIQYLRKITKSRVPASSQEAADLFWIPNPRVGATVSSNCLPGGSGPCPIIARLRINTGSVKTCHLIQTQGTNPMVCPFEFKSLTGTTLGSIEPQAVADGFMVTFKILASQKLVLRASTGSKPFSLQLGAQAGKSIDVFIINVPVEDHSKDECHSFIKDRHFELYYHVSKQENGVPIPLNTRPIPQMLNVGCVASVQPAGDDQCPLLVQATKQVPGFKQVSGFIVIPLDKPACATRQFLPP